MSCMVHPDRPSSDRSQMANFQKFQGLSRVYSVLSNHDSRVLYNREGAVKLETNEDRIRDYRGWWQERFGRLDFKDIREFEASYRGSPEELKELKTAYVRYEGNIDSLMLNSLCCGSHDDLERHIKNIQQMIDNDQLPMFGMFQEYLSNRRKASTKHHRIMKMANVTTSVPKNPREPPPEENSPQLASKQPTSSVNDDSGATAVLDSQSSDRLTCTGEFITDDIARAPVVFPIS